MIQRIPLLAAVIWTLSLPSHLSHAAERPNILVITVDDMSCDSVGVYGCKLADTTPNMDALARTAMRFRYAHVQVGNCMPSRNVMWSGRYPHNNGIEGFYANPHPQYPVLCDLAKQAGYFTGIRHKVSHSTPYSPYAWDIDLDAPAEGPKPHIKDASSYGRSTTQGIELAKAAGKPFCLLINISDPHKPFYTDVKQGKDPHVPSRVFTADEIPVPGFLPDDPVVKEELALYYSSVRRADDGVGAILNALDASNCADNTIVFFLADHGMPLPFAKTQLYHHSTHTPLMIRWPSVTEPNTEDAEHMVSAVDFLPTLLDIMDVAHPEALDGRSFATVLRGEKQQERDFVVKEYNENSGGKRNPMRAVQNRNHLYIFNPWANGTRMMATATNGTATYRRMKELAKTDSYVAKRLDLADFRTPEELYDVVADPDCLHNLANATEHLNTLNQLRQLLENELRRTGDPLADILASRDSTAMEVYVNAEQASADERRQSKRKRNESRQPSQTKPAKRNGLIKIESVDVQIPEVTIKISHNVPEDLGEQSIHVTLKDTKQGRIERKVVQVSGTGETELVFRLTSIDKTVGHVAAFIGAAYETHLEHLQVSVP